MNLGQSICWNHEMKVWIVPLNQTKNPIDFVLEHSFAGFGQLSSSLTFLVVHNDALRFVGRPYPTPTQCSHTYTWPMVYCNIF
jgi:hypothetical protein